MSLKRNLGYFEQVHDPDENYKCMGCGVIVNYKHVLKPNGECKICREECHNWVESGRADDEVGGATN